MKTLAMIGFDRLREMHATMDLVMAVWQPNGPWLLVTFGQPSTTDGDIHACYPFAILKTTGAVYGIHDGEVDDEPLLTV